MKLLQPRVFPFQYPVCIPRLAFVILLALAANLGLHKEHVLGATSITQTTGAGDLGTQVLPPSGHVYGITGGTPVGTNLYHSFAQFNVGTGDIAQFQTPTLMPNTAMDNILGRITDANPSTIFGTIDSATYYPNASLFLMNPHGFLFGPNAMVNVGGMVTFTTANYLQLADNVRFEAVPGTQDALLSTASVRAFGFLGSNPAAIAIQGSQLTVANGTGLSLVGGNRGFTYTNPDTGATASVPGGVTMTGGTLSAHGGQINIASVASPGEVSADDFTPASGMTMGDINLSQGATLDVSGNAAGTVRIRGGQFLIADATISADTVNAKGALTAVDIQLTGNLSISNDLVPAITARTTGSGDSGAIKIASANFTAASNTIDILSLIDTHTSGTGKAGNVSVETGDLQVTGSLEGFATFIDTGTEGPGHGGTVTITAQNVQMDFFLINTGNFWANAFGVDATGSAGNVNILTDSLNLNFSQIVTDAFSFANGTGQSGDITVTAHDISLDTSQFSSQGHQRGGAITITTDQLLASDSQVIALTNLMSGGGVTITGKSIELSTGSSVVSSTGGNGDAGPIHITATDHLGLLRASATDRPSGIFSNSFGTFGSAGNAGDIVITTPSLEMTGGARINTTTATSGHGGNVTINATDLISMSGETGSFAPEPLFSLGGIQPSGIFTRTIGGNCSGPCGDAGNISVTTGSLTLDRGGQIDSGTTTSGHGGEILIHATDTISLSGTLSNGSPVGVLSRTIGTIPDAGSGGNIALTAGQSVTISDGASVSASSTGAGNAGSVTIEGPQSPAQSVLLDGPNSGIFTDTQGTGAGGDITINANSVTLQNGGMLSSATSGATPTATGGTITIAATDVQLSTGALITAQTTGAGNAGDVLVKADSVSITDGAQLTSSSMIGDSGELPTGNAGNITVQGLTGPAQAVLITGIFDENFNLIGGISTETKGTGAGGTINISADDVHLEGATLSAQTSSSGKAGDIAIQASQLTVDGSAIRAETTGDGNAGTILLQTTGNLSVSGSEIKSEVNPDLARGFTGGQAGTIQLLAGQDISLTNSSLLTSHNAGNKSGGEIVVNGNNLLVEGGTTLLSASAPPEGAGFTGGDAGDIRIEVNGTTRFVDAGINTSTGGNGHAGDISVTTSMLALEGDSVVSIQSTTSPISGLHGGRGGNILLKIDQMTVTGNATVSSDSNNSAGQAGNITVIAKESVELFGSGVQPNTITTSSVGAVPSCPGKCGDAGTISISAQTLTLDRTGLSSTTSGDGNAGSVELALGTLTVRNGSRISAGANGPLSTGAGGNIAINATGSVDISNPGQVVGHSRSSGVFTNTDGSGPGGNILVNANTVTLQNSGTLSAKTSGTAPTATGGTVTVTATNTVAMNNTALITARSEGTADAGSIDITATNGFTMQNSTLTTLAGQGASGGNIKVTTAPSATVLLQGSLISASVSDGPGGGGNISIDPQFVILQNSQILAQADQGQGGAITITAGLFLPDATSKVDANSGSGVNGTVTIQSPNAPVSGQIQPLGKSPLIATSLLNQRCAALAGGEFSSFTVAGRNSLPTEPGSWLASPPAFDSGGLSAGNVTMGGDWGLVVNPTNETTLLSLRQIAPAGFLTQTFPENWSAGCKS